MKAKLYPALICIFCTYIVTAQESNTEWYQKAQGYIHSLQYSFRPASTHQYNTANPANGISFHIHQQGYHVKSMQDGSSKKQWSAGFKLLTIGRENKLKKFGPLLTSGLRNDTLVQNFSSASVEYINSEKGLRQNFILQNKPAGKGRLRINIKLDKNKSISPAIVNGNSLVLQSAHKIIFSYEGLKVWDANHRIIDAWMELNKSKDELSIVVNDTEAVYPLTVDPLNKNPEWTTSAEGVLPALLNNLNLQVQATYGYTVAGIGDINHDGYDDVAVGAPSMADVISGTGNLLGVGAVFIYLGSQDSLAVIPSKVLQPTTAVAGALFGFSITSGNITADGHSDLVISAPLDSYTTSAASALGAVNVTVTAGKVYLYASETLFSSGNPSPFAQIHLSGTGFFSAGILNVLGSNISAKALFGFSVSTTGDVNGDNRDDIIIGCPAYVGTSLLAVHSGAAFVYYSNGLSTTTPVQLNLPTPSVLGLVSLPVANLNGLLFGFSVDGVGDFNNDGFNDVVVGAPAGIDLSSLPGIFSGQVLGGAAYVYYGTGVGINPAIGDTLQAASGPNALLSNAANLFGYKVKGVKNAAGVRNGNILIDAPSGAVLSNVIGGLRLKAGQVHVFRKRAGSNNGVIVSNQILTSPRASSVLSLLSGQTLNVSLLYGAGMDNMGDINCDGFADIIVGEPLSTTVPVLGANITGGAAYMYLGRSDGTYQPAPVWTLTPAISSSLGINAISLIGFNVANAGRTQSDTHTRAIVGGPASALDFGAGLLNLGNTVGVLYSFAAGNNGPGKSYIFNANLCGLVTLPARSLQFSGQRKDEQSVILKWETQEEPNLNYYNLERSYDGVNFSTIVIVFAQGNAKNIYPYTDKKASGNNVYYRLKMVDKDETFSYSNTVFVKGIAGGAMMTATPNPATTDITIRLTGYASGNYTMTVYNSAGIPQATKGVYLTGEIQLLSFSRSGMTPGVYWVSLFDHKGVKHGTVSLLLR